MGVKGASQNSPQRLGFRWLRILIIVGLLGILAATLYPPLLSTWRKSQLVGSVSNMRQIYLAALQMAADHDASADPRLGWPGDLAQSRTNPIASLEEWVELLASTNYIKRKDTAQVFSGPGVPRYSGAGPLHAANSAFKIYLVREEDVSQCVFAATRNFTYGRGLSADVKPYGDSGCAIMRKGGDGLSLGKRQALSSFLVGYLPGSATSEPAGEEEGKVWR